MPLDALLTRLARETDDQVAALLEAARRDAARARPEAAAETDRERAARLEAIDAGHRTALARESEAARQHGTVTLLQARRRAVERVLTAVRARLAEAVADTSYLTAMAAELDDALAVLGGKPAILEAPPALAAIARRRPDAPQEILDYPDLAGFRLRSADGSVEVDATLEERLRRLAPAIAIEVVRALEEAA